MSETIFTGKLTRLVGIEPEKAGERMAQWSRDSEYVQLYNSSQAAPRYAKQIQDRLRNELDKARPGDFYFLVQPLDDERVIGEVGLWSALTPHRNAWLAVAIGERELWGKGYGSDAVRITLRYGFQELNLHRINLNVFGYNTRAIRAYEKLGFAHEGAIRGALKRYGRRWDILFMGILREEWERAQVAGSK
ncbi:MAG TPA: GNAT family protein [Anaerolineae bacterium]|nr:GNAT family protein [Anaerolineae bacterium]